MRTNTVQSGRVGVEELCRNYAVYFIYTSVRHYDHCLWIKYIVSSIDPVPIIYCVFSNHYLFSRNCL